MTVLANLPPDPSRPIIEAEIERLIDMLDIMDIDPDLEPQGDEEPDDDGEPELGWTDTEAKKGRYAQHSGNYDVDEASLGWSAPWMPSPEHTGYGMSIAMIRLLDLSDVYPRKCNNVIWDPRDLHLSQGVGQDLEEQCEDEGVDVDIDNDRADDEPSLGSNACIGAFIGSGGAVAMVAGRWIWQRSTGNEWSQDYWATGATDDCEGCEHDGREPDVDQECEDIPHFMPDVKTFVGMFPEQRS